jgi:hypothetical protein
MISNKYNIVNVLSSLSNACIIAVEHNLLFQEFNITKFNELLPEGTYIFNKQHESKTKIVLEIIEEVISVLNSESNLEMYYITKDFYNKLFNNFRQNLLFLQCS